MRSPWSLHATPGGTASQKRNVSLKLSVPHLRGTFAGLKLDVSARATNAHNEMWNAKKVSLFWSRQAPLTPPPCPSFSPPRAEHVASARHAGHRRLERGDPLAGVGGKKTTITWTQ